MKNCLTVCLCTSYDSVEKIRMYAFLPPLINLLDCLYMFYCNDIYKQKATLGYYHPIFLSFA